MSNSIVKFAAAAIVRGVKATYLPHAQRRECSKLAEQFEEMARSLDIAQADDHESSKTVTLQVEYLLQLADEIGVAMQTGLEN